MSRLRSAPVGLALAISAWSLSPLLIYESRGLADAPVLALYAVAFGSALAWATLLSSGQLRLAQVAELARRGAWLGEAALVGLTAFIAYPLLYFAAIQSGPPAAVNLVNYLWPVIAVVVVSYWRPHSRSLEVALAASFGFAGAGLAIAAGVDVGTSGGELEASPFVLAGLAALAYGVTSGAIGVRHPTDRVDSVQLFTVALLLGGGIALAILVYLGLTRPSSVSLDLGDSRLLALAAYAVLLPLAHLSWMNAVRDPRVPAFSSAFLVPVISTGILTLVVTGVAKPEVLSALVLVLCGITFASAREKGVPVGYAVTLAFLASIQVSQVLAGRVHGQVNLQIASIGELIAAIFAVFAGFVLANAIQRYGALQKACGLFYARAWQLKGEVPEAGIQRQLDRLDAMVVRGGEDDRGGEEDRDRGGDDDRASDFARQWADVEVAASNDVSSFEWLVLLVGGGGLLIALHAYAIGSTAVATVLLRAFGAALIVGVLFAIRDYDRRRPQRLCQLLRSLRTRYEIPIAEGSPLSLGVVYWTEAAPTSVRLGLVALILVSVGAITLNA